MPLCEDFLEYLKAERNKSDETIKNYGTALRQFEEFCESLGEGLTWNTVTGDVVREWIVYLADERHLKNGTINVNLSALRTFYHYLKRIGEVTLNPMLRIEGPKKDKHLPVFVREKDMDSLLDGPFPSSYRGCLERTVLSALYMTGMRKSEIQSLQDSDVDFVSKQIKVTGKRNKQRLIPFGPELEECLREYMGKRNEKFPSGAGRLFVSERGKPMGNKVLADIVRLYLSKVTTLSKKTPHVLRHSFATAMLNNHADLVSIQKLLGHADLHTTEVYTHLSFEELKNEYENAHPRSKK